MNVAKEQSSAMRQMEVRGLEFIGPCPDHLSETWIQVPLPDGQFNQTRIVWPKYSDNQASKCPLIIYMHGGGFYTCSPDLVLAPARGFAQVFNAIVACPSINLLFEQPYPAPIRVAWEVCAWLSDVANLNEGVLKDERIVVDLSCGFIIGGLSSGGTAAAVISGLIAAKSTTAIPEYAHLSSIQMPFSGAFVGLPFLVTEKMLPVEFKGQLLSRRDKERTAFIEELLDDYIQTPWFSPLNYDKCTADFAKNHPPKVFIYSTSLDVFRDDAVMYKKWLDRLDGVESKLVEVPDEDHTAWVCPPWPASHSQTIKEVTLDGMGWLLGRKWDKAQKLPI